MASTTGTPAVFHFHLRGKIKPAEWWLSPACTGRYEEMKNLPFSKFKTLTGGSFYCCRRITAAMRLHRRWHADAKWQRERRTSAWPSLLIAVIIGPPLISADAIAFFKIGAGPPLLQTARDRGKCTPPPLAGGPVSWRTAQSEESCTVVTRKNISSAPNRFVPPRAFLICAWRGRKKSLWPCGGSFYFDYLFKRFAGFPALVSVFFVPPPRLSGAAPMSRRDPQTRIDVFWTAFNQSPRRGGLS